MHDYATYDELALQSLNDEPARVLLEKIRAEHYDGCAGGRERSGRQNSENLV